MTIFRHAATTALLTLCLATAAYGQSIATDETEEFSGERQVISEGVAVEHDGSHTTYVRTYYSAGMYTLLLDVYADSWQHLGASSADGVAYDGETPERFRIGVVGITHEVRDGGRIYERHALALPPETWEVVRRADRVRLRISGVVYTLSADAQAEMRLVMERVEE